MRKQAGLAIVTFSLASAIIVPLLGLGLDAAMLCVMKERLASAVDSAANAASKHPEKGVKMESAARRFLDANFPEGHLGTAHRTIAFKDDQLVVRVDAPTYFMKLLHVGTVEVAAVSNLAR